MMRSSAMPAALLAVVLAVALVACGGAGEAGNGADEAPVDEPVGETAVVDSPAAARTETGGGPEAGGGDDPFTGFELEAPPGAGTDTVRVALRLRNDATAPAIVYADGGAGEVLLDTVPASSALRVDVLTRARRIALRSVDPTGEELRTTEVDAGLETVMEVIVGRQPVERR